MAIIQTKAPEKKHQNAITILGEATQNGYASIKKSLDKQCSTLLPSFHHLTKDRPKVIELSLKPCYAFDTTTIDSILQTFHEVRTDEVALADVNHTRIIENGGITMDVDEKTALLRTAQAGNRIVRGKVSENYKITSKE